MYMESIAALASKTNLILLYPIPEVGWVVPKSLHVAKLQNMLIENSFLSTDYSLFKSRNAAVYRIFDQIKGDLTRIKVEEYFCDTYVSNRCVSQLNGVPLYYDDDHLSDFGTSFIIPKIVSSLRD
jgi:hypothetical protein